MQASSLLSQILSQEVDAVEDALDASTKDVALKPEDDLRGEASDPNAKHRSAEERDRARRKRKVPFKVQVSLPDSNVVKSVEIGDHDLPWDDFLVHVRDALDLKAPIDALFDDSGAQVTAVQYLEDGDSLSIRIDDSHSIASASSKESRESKTLASVRSLLKSTQTALWDKFIRRINEGFKATDHDYAFDELTGLTFEERARWIPLRLTLKERKVLRLVKAALGSSEYTSKVDRAFKSDSRRLRTQIHEICALISGVVTALDFDAGRAMIESRHFSDHEKTLQAVFDIARRHKILNPEKMRSGYAKLAYLMQDAATERVSSLIEVKLFAPMRTVRATLVSRGAEDLLRDPLVPLATMECPDDKSKTRQELQRRINVKQRAIRKLCRKYKSSEISSSLIQECLHAIGDNSAYLSFHREPIDKMIHLLTHFFSPDEIRDPAFSLAIVAGESNDAVKSNDAAKLGSARLTHSHGRQFHFVLQSLMLWREVTNNMFKLWCVAEEDLQGSDYRLVETGQGLNRVQNSPRVMRAMREILHSVQQRCDTWIGSSVVHLGDKNVPNAIFFIDKYTQISRILRPIITAVEHIPRICKRPGIRAYVESAFGGQRRLANIILHDFFKHGFDGGGALNFFDAGSCIDGRLTSAWNWCSQLHLKSFYPIFKLTGFTSFDGTEFQE